jgi:glycosyltransferase involved in cell wall biosynthesis
VQRLSRALAQRGHQVTVVHCIDAYHISGGQSSPEPIQAEQGITVHALKSNWGPLSPLITHQLAVPGLKGQELRRIIEGDDFDVIHFHNISLIGGPGVLDYGSGVKFYTAHEYWLLCPLSTLWKYDQESCVKKDCVRCTVRAGKPPQLWRYTNTLQRKLAQMDAILAPSEFVVKSHSDRGLKLDFTLMPNFLPMPAEVQKNGSLESIGGRPFFLTVGRLEKSKGFHKVIEYFATEENADLLVVGTGPYEPQLKELADGSENIRFTGYLPYDELVLLYAAATAVIVPSIWQEPFGLIVLEAFAQSTPVIVHNAGALPELATFSGGGLVYKELAEMGGHIDAMLNDSDLRNSLGDKGHQAYLENWTEDVHLSQYFRLIDEVKSSKASTSD